MISKMKTIPGGPIRPPDKSPGKRPKKKKKDK